MRMIPRKQTRKIALTTAGWFRLKRRQARWFGVRCSGSTERTAAASAGRDDAVEGVGGPLLITNSRIEQTVAQVDHQIEHKQQDGIEDHQANDHRVVAIGRAVDEKDADTGDLKNIFDHEGAGQKI